jgi:predicted GNAT family N-acyltransferase
MSQESMTLVVKKIIDETDLEVCLKIRHDVFIKEQFVSEAEEIDGEDPTVEHFLLYFNRQAIGTARVRYINTRAKIERVAILNTFRGRGFGKVLMDAILKDLRASKKTAWATLGAQTYAIAFYEKLGFTVYSDEYMDAGIPHKDMKLHLE